RFVFPNRSSAVLLECRHLAEALHNHTDVGLGPTVLAHLYKNLHIATLENPLNLSAPEMPKCSIEEYLMFFQHCTKRSAAQWQVVIRRTYPSFQPRFRLFEKEPKEEAARIDFRQKFLSVTLPRDLHFGGGNLLTITWGQNANALFHGLPASSTTLKVLFDGWDSWTVYAEAKNFMVWIAFGLSSSSCPVTFVIAAGDLELPFGDEGETLAEPTAAQYSAVQPETSAESRPLASTRSKRLRKKTEVEYVATEKPAAAPTTTSGTDEELREAFEAVEQENEQEKKGDAPTKEKENEFGEEEIPAEVIAESIALAKQQQEAQRAEPTSSELALFDDVEAEHSTAVLPSASKPVEQAELPVAVPDPGAEAEVSRTAGILAVVTSSFKPPIVAMLIHSIPGSFATTSFADPELAEFEAMDLDAQLDKLVKLSYTPGKAKSKAVDEAMDRVRIWQSVELDLDDSGEAFDQLMNMAPTPILELSLGLARDVLNLHNRYEDLKPSFKISEFCKATHEANLADYTKQKAELDQMVAGYKEAKTAANKLEQHIEELQKQLAGLRERQNKLEAGLGTKTKATFLVQNMVAASRLALEIAEASLHQGILLQQEICTKKIGLQETLRKLGL
ncbi:unnamed protein product, partial [Prunus brigantina]